MAEFITYAQNFEDLMLYRALKGVGPGFYIDVGAADPDSHSVTRAFYERGWRGINIEPTPARHARLTAARPEDVNVCAAVARQPGQGTFFTVDGDSGLCTTQPAMAEWHRSCGRTVEERTVDFITLQQVCQQHADGRDIHFLKIDAEGAELDVLQSHDFTRWRPWIVVGEAHDAARSATGWRVWEDLLVAADYRFVYDDGLNRFYVEADRHASLARGFEVPPNVYDDWILAEHHYLRERFAREGS